MPRPWKSIERCAQSGLELRQRDDHDFMILDQGRVLMSSLIHRSEVAVAELGCEGIRDRPAPRVLIGGLGLGFTLRAALDGLPRKAEVVVAELNPVVVRWCEGPVAPLTNHSLRDPRVQVVVGDVTAEIRRAARGSPAKRYDAIILDLYVGPGASAHVTEPFYGSAILRDTHAALTQGGVYAVWAEDPDPPFERRLERVGFAARLLRVAGGGPRHAVYLAEKASRDAPRRGEPRPIGRAKAPAAAPRARARTPRS